MARERYTWRETYARCRRLASALARRGIGKNDTVAVMAPNTPPMYEAHFGVPMCGAVLNTLNTRLDAETDRLHAAPRRRARADHRPRVLRRSSARRWHCSTPGRWSSTSTIRLCQDGELLGETDLRSVPGGGRSGLRLANPGRRMGCDLAELHLRHHRRSEGRGLSPSRRASERGQQHPQLGHAAPRGVSLDAADVPLQRLVLSLDRRRARRRQRLPAPGRGEGRMLDAIRDARRDAYVRRADRLFHADQCAGGTARRACANASPARSPAPRRPPRSSKAPRRSASN